MGFQLGLMKGEWGLGRSRLCSTMSGWVQGFSIWGSGSHRAPIDGLGPWSETTGFDWNEVGLDFWGLCG